MISVNSILIAASLAFLASAGGPELNRDIADIAVYASGDCHNYIQTYVRGDDGHDGDCKRFNITRNNKPIFAVDLKYLIDDPGCSGKSIENSLCGV